MNKMNLVSSVLWLLAATSPMVSAHDSGVIREGEIYQSQRLGKDVRYSIYLPAAYQRDTNRRFPVLYLLHGYPTEPHDADTDWIQFGDIGAILDSEIAKGTSTAIIVVMPDMGRSWYVDGEEPYGSMLAEGLVPHIDATYRTRAQQVFRAIGGLSMGGFGALAIAMNNPDLFAASVALSAGVYTSEELQAFPEDIYENAFAHWVGRGLEGEERVTDAWLRNNPLYLAEALPLEDLRATRWYLDVGDDDFLYKGNAALHILLRDREVEHEYRVRNGGHDWEYWRSAMPAALAFISGRLP